MRKLLLFGALAAIVVWVAVEPARKDAAAPSTREAAMSEGARAKAAEPLELPDRRGLGRARGELFGAPPAPPPQPAAAPVVQAAPVPPPLRYRFAGKVRRGAEEEVLISRGELVFPVRVGDMLDGMYRVESIGADRIELLYLPLGTKDRIIVSSAFEVEPASAPVAAVSAPAPLATPAPAALSDGGPAQLRWEGPERVQAGASFSVALRVSTSERLRAAPMQLRFEPGVLEPVNVRPGKFFGLGSFSYRVSPEGAIFVGATSRAAAPGADAELLIVTFRPIRRGAIAELDMTALSLQGVAGRAIAHRQPSAFRAAIH